MPRGGVELHLYSFFNLGARWGGWPRPGRFTPGKETRYPLHRRLGGPQVRSGRGAENFAGPPNPLQIATPAYKNAWRFFCLVHPLYGWLRSQIFTGLVVNTDILMNSALFGPSASTQTLIARHSSMVNGLVSMMSKYGETSEKGLLNEPTLSNL